MRLTCGFTIGGQTTSQDFSDAMQTVIGDGISEAYGGGQFRLTVNGFSLTLSSGYAFSAGRFIRNDELLPLSVQLPGNTEDRIDAVAVWVDYTARQVRLEILADVDKNEILSDPTVLRDGDQYAMVLYFVRVRRGATSLTLDDITDVRSNGALCGMVPAWSAIAENALYIYNFLNGGIDTEVDRLIALSDAIIAKADAAIASMDYAIAKTGAVPAAGELMTSITAPTEVGWLLCDGSAVPDAYPELNEILDDTLPDIQVIDGRFKTYIYGGKPVEGGA